MKLFVVVGSIFPFDRLIKTVDSWISEYNNLQVIAQIGDSKICPKNMTYYKKLQVKDFNRIFDDADLIISHAGMGIILKSLEAGKPIVVMPRRLDLKEHNTNHQIDTAKAFKAMNYIHVAMNEKELITILKDPTSLKSRHTINPYASESLIKSIKDFIDS